MGDVGGHGDGPYILTDAGFSRPCATVFLSGAIKSASDFIRVRIAVAEAGGALQKTPQGFHAFKVGIQSLHQLVHPHLSVLIDQLLHCRQSIHHGSETDEVIESEIKPSLDFLAGMQIPA